MASINRFEEMEIWQESMSLAVDVYKLLKQDSFDKQFAISDQLRRSALSISSNIAEGFEHSNNKQFVRFLYYAKASAGEARSQFYLIRELELIDKKTYQLFEKRLITIAKKITGFIKYLTANQ